MKTRRGAPRLIVSAVLLALTGGGCSILVAGDVPDVACIDTTSACPSGLRCDTTTKRCVSADGSAPDPDAGDEDVLTEDVRDGGGDGDASGPLDLGAMCRVDAECKSKLCASSTVLTTTITSTTGPICTSPCCTSAECPSTFVCFNGGTGGGYCVPATLAQRTPPATGGKGGGVSCATNGECRSGLCTGSPKSCLDTCCVGTDCGGTTVCRIKSVAAPGPTHDLWVCAAPEPTGTKDPGVACSDSGQSCKTDTCIPGGGGLCRPPCSNTASCTALAAFSTGHCLYGTSGIDSFKFCQATTFIGRLAAGLACTDPSECQSDYCDAELKKCANVCGKNADCLPTEACRPSAVNTPLLRCVKKP